MHQGYDKDNETIIDHLVYTLKKLLLISKKDAEAIILWSVWQ